MSYSNTNRDQIWPNEREKNDTHPDFKGSVNIQGEEYSISAWQNQGGTRPGNLSLSFPVEPKNETRVEPAKDYVVQVDNQTRGGYSQRRKTDQAGGLKICSAALIAKSRASQYCAGRCSVPDR